MKNGWFVVSGLKPTKTKKIKKLWPIIPQPKHYPLLPNLQEPLCNTHVNLIRLHFAIWLTTTALKTTPIKTFHLLKIWGIEAKSNLCVLQNPRGQGGAVRNLMCRSMCWTAGSLRDPSPPLAKPGTALINECSLHVEWWYYTVTALQHTAMN